jgi:hypothetical protein
MLFHVYFDRTSGTVKKVLRLDNLDWESIGP